MEPPDWDLNDDPPIDWDPIAEWKGPARELDCHYLWNDGQDQGKLAEGDEGSTIRFN